VAAHLASVSNRIMGLPCSSHTAWGLEFNPILVRPVQREHPFFPQACGRPICFEIGCVNHNPLATGPLICQSCRNPLGHDVGSSGRSGYTGSCAPYSLGASTRRPSRPAPSSAATRTLAGRAMARPGRAKGLSLLRLVDWRRRSRRTVLAGNVALPIGALFVGLLIFLDAVVYQPAN
jgi:hypothetical protein